MHNIENLSLAELSHNLSSARAEAESNIALAKKMDLESANLAEKSSNLRKKAAQGVSYALRAYDTERYRILYLKWQEACVGYCTKCKTTHPIDSLVLLQIDAETSGRESGYYNQIDRKKKRAISCMRCALPIAEKSFPINSDGFYCLVETTYMTKESMAQLYIHGQKFKNEDFDYTVGPTKISSALAEEWNLPSGPNCS